MTKAKLELLIARAIREALENVATEVDSDADAEKTLVFGRFGKDTFTIRVNVA